MLVSCMLTPQHCYSWYALLFCLYSEGISWQRQVYYRSRWWWAVHSDSSLPKVDELRYVKMNVCSNPGVRLLNITPQG